MISRRNAHSRDGISSSSYDRTINQGVDAETLDFIQKYLTTYTKWEVLKHFSENPNIVESPRGFARKLGKELRQVSEAFKSLARAGLLSNGRDSEDAGCSLTANEAQRNTLRKIADSARLNNRFRLLLNYHITKASLAKYRSRM